MSMAMHNELRALEARVAALEAAGKTGLMSPGDFATIAKSFPVGKQQPTLGLKKTA